MNLLLQEDALRKTTNSQNVKHLVQKLKHLNAPNADIHPSALNILTAFSRVLPNFLIIGPPKSGTSSLFYYLCLHPCVAIPKKKEIYFFDLDYSNGMNWYKAHFPTIFQKYIMIAQHGYFSTGEATPSYLFNPHAPKRVYQSIPDVKLIILLRNPIDRAYSHYYHMVRCGYESLSFGDAIAKEQEWLPRERELYSLDDKYISSRYRNFSYLAQSIYIDQILNWHKYFSKQQLLIINSEHFYNNTRAAMKTAYDFLSLPENILNQFQPTNVSRYPPMNPTTRKKLIEYFMPHNQRLYDYLALNYGWDNET